MTLKLFVRSENPRKVSVGYVTAADVPVYLMHVECAVAGAEELAKKICVACSSVDAIICGAVETRIAAEEGVSTTQKRRED